jgi:hypothetical protein
MIESPLIKELRAEDRQEAILDVLTARFGAVPQNVRKPLRSVVELKRLRALTRVAAQCPDLETFRQHLPS